MPDPATGAEKIDAANKLTASQALIIQAYCLSVQEQPPLNFGGQKHLEIYQTQINAGLTTAKGHASNYLDVIQPAVILNISNISAYYTIHNAVPATLPPGSTTAEWLEVLGALQSQAVTFKGTARDTVVKLRTLRDALAIDSTSFAKTVEELNTAVNGDNGVLAADDKSLSDIGGKIDGAITGAVMSGLAMIGGVFMICVGAIADFVTAGTTTPLVVGGIGVLITGAGGEAGSAVALVGLCNQRAKLLDEESVLKAEVKLALGIKSAYQALSDKVNASVEAATQMQSAWEFLEAGLGSMITELNNGITDSGVLRRLFLNAANGIVGTLLTDINTIKNQMDGVVVKKAAPGQTVSNLIQSVADQRAA